MLLCVYVCVCDNNEVRCCESVAVRCVAVCECMCGNWFVRALFASVGSTANIKNGFFMFMYTPYTYGMCVLYGICVLYVNSVGVKRDVRAMCICNRGEHL